MAPVFFSLHPPDISRRLMYFNGMTPDLRPMLATLTDGPFDDPGWVFETKWDGFRAIAVARPGQARLYSRRGHDVSAKYPTICAALAAIRHDAVLDGELVA